jgi:hypothetical protein
VRWGVALSAGLLALAAAATGASAAEQVVVPRHGEAYAPGTTFRLPRACPVRFTPEMRQRPSSAFYAVGNRGGRNKIDPDDDHGHDDYRWTPRGLMILRPGGYVAEWACLQARKGTDGIVVTPTRVQTRAFSIGCREGRRGFCIVAVRMATFIPSPAIAAPFSLFGADDRGFSPTSSRYRSLQAVTVDLDPRNDPEKLGPVTGFGWSNEYDPGVGREAPGKPSWWRELEAGAEPLCRERQRATPGRISIGAVQFSGRDSDLSEVTVSLELSAALPACATPVVRMFAQAIDAELNLYIRQRRGRLPQFKVEGRHDGFPAYELYVDDGCAYTYDPVGAGAGPGALGGRMDEAVRFRQWRDVVPWMGCPPINFGPALPDPG